MNEDPSAALMLACTCSTERRRYHNLSCPSAKKLVWRNAFEAACLAGHFELTKALLLLHEEAFNWTPMDIYRPVLASPNPDILPLVFGKTEPTLNIYFPACTISWPVFERYFMHQIDRRNDIDMKQCLSRALNEDWISSFITCYYQRPLTIAGEKVYLDDVAYVSQYGRLKDVQMVAKVFGEIFPASLCTVGALRGAKLETVQWVLMSYPGTSLYQNLNPVQWVLMGYEESKFHNDIFPMLQFLLKRKVVPPQVWTTCIFSRLRDSKRQPNNSTIQSLLSRLLELGFPNNVCDLGNITSFQSTLRIELLRWLGTRFKCVNYEFYQCPFELL